MRAFVLAALLSTSGAFAGEIGYRVTDIGTVGGTYIDISGISLQISLTSANSAQLQFTAQPNTGYVIESSDSLSAATWQPLVVLDPAPTVHEVIFTDPAFPAAGMRFYRVRSSGGGMLKSARGPLASDAVVSLAGGASATGMPEFWTQHFAFDNHHPADLPSSADSAALSTEEASVLARRLANDEAERLYHVRPFLRNSPARWMSFRWIWRERQGYGHADFEADVQFGPTAAHPVVKVILIESQLSISF